jgi:drug/metabolite transporter (DMT)-like permease
MIGIAFGIIGIIVLNLDSLTDVSTLSAFSLKGEGLLLLSGVFGSLGQITAKKRCHNIPPMTLNGWQMTLGGGVLLIIGSTMNRGLVSFPSVFSLFLMSYSIMVAAVGFTLWYFLLLRTSVNDIVPYRLTIPVLGSIFSALFLPGESLTLNIILGLAIVVFGMYIITFFNDKDLKVRVDTD